MTNSTWNSFLKRQYVTFSSLTEKKKNRIFLFCALIVSLSIKLTLLILMHDATINTDGTLYIKAAMEFAAGNFAGGIDIYPMPAYPLILAVAHMIIPDWIMAGYIVSIACMVLVTIPLFHITRISAGPNAAFWSCLVFAVLPQINEWSFYISRDPIFLLTVSWFVSFALYSIRKNDTTAYLGAFLLAWLSILFRVEGCIILFFYLTVLIGLGLLKKKQRQFYFFGDFLWLGVPAIIASILFFFTWP
mgnify:CR=1 FL=1